MTEQQQRLCRVLDHGGNIGLLLLAYGGWYCLFPGKHNYGYRDDVNFGLTVILVGIGIWAATRVIIYILSGQIPEVTKERSRILDYGGQIIGWLFVAYGSWLMVYGRYVQDRQVGLTLFLVAVGVWGASRLTSPGGWVWIAVIAMVLGAFTVLIALTGTPADYPWLSKEIWRLMVLMTLALAALAVLRYIMDRRARRQSVG